MTKQAKRHRWTQLTTALALAAMIFPASAQADVQLADLSVKQSMTVTASGDGMLAGKSLYAIRLAAYTAASVQDGRIVGYDVATNGDLTQSIAASAKTVGATDDDLKVNGKTDPMVWVVRELTDSKSGLWNGKLRDFCNSLAKQSEFQAQTGVAVDKLGADGKTTTTGNVLVPGIYAVVDRTSPTDGAGEPVEAAIMMMNGTAINDITQLVTSSGQTTTLGQVVYKVSDVEAPDKKAKSADDWKTVVSEAIGTNVTYRITQKIPNWTGYEHYYFALNDTLGSGLDYVGLQSVSVDGKTLSESFYHETIDGRKISWLFGDSNGDLLASDETKTALPVGSTITVVYTAKLNGDAVIGSPCNVNSVDLEYSHNPNGWQDHSTLPGNEVKTCTGAVQLRKVDANGEQISGAKFTISQNADGTQALNLVKTGEGRYRLATDKDTTGTVSEFEAGNTTIEGLKGTYVIRERQAPEGFSSLALPNAVFTVNIDETDMTWSVDVTTDPNKLVKAEGIQTIVITNIRSITQMPLTGAAGLTATLALATILLVAGLIFLRMSRKTGD